MNPRPEDVQAAFCAVLCEEWARAGVTDAVVAPGSRSTPLTAAIAAQRAIRAHVVLDERAAAFTALGLGLASRRPALVVTTSGTASVELHPALAEAFAAAVPLVAVTTDRPPELHGVGAPQTLDQTSLFAGAVRWSAHPGVPDAASAGGWRSLASRSVHEALTGPGPVHLNLAFREPLMGDPAAVDVPAGRPGGAPWHGDPAGPVPGASTPVGAAADLLGSYAGRRGIVVAGHGTAFDPGEADAVLSMAERLGWPVLADPRSGCRLPHRSVVAAADAILRGADFPGAVPEVVLCTGAPWASKVLGRWLAGLPAGVPQVLVDRWGRWLDPDRSAAMVVAAPPTLVAAAVTGVAHGEPGWSDAWAEREAAAQGAIGRLLDAGGELAGSEPAVARAVLASVPDGGALVVSSSMPVRDVEWYGAPRRGATVHCNRGVNGIDGVMATAVGVALGTPAPTHVLIGDLAFLYDAGALLWAASRSIDLRVVVVDNDGGGIFSFLPQATTFDGATFERYWGTPHGVDLVAVAAAYGIEATGLADRGSLDAWLADPRPGVRVGVVRSDRTANVDAHERIHGAVTGA